MGRAGERDFGPIRGADVPVSEAVYLAKDGLPKGRTPKCLDQFIAKRRINFQDFEAICHALNTDPAGGSFTQVIHRLRAQILGTGWKIVSLGSATYELRPGEDLGRARRMGLEDMRRLRLEEADARRREEAEAARKREAAAAVLRPAKPQAQPGYTGGARREPLHVAYAEFSPPGAARPKIAKAPDGCCQYIIVMDGNVTPCGRKCKGVYCDEHRAATAGVSYREGRR